MTTVELFPSPPSVVSFVGKYPISSDMTENGGAAWDGRASTTTKKGGRRRRRFAIIDPRRKSPREEEDADDADVDDADSDARVDDRRLSGDDDGGNGGVSAVASRMEDGDDNITTTHRTNKVVHEATGRNIVRSLVDVTGLG